MSGTIHLAKLKEPFPPDCVSWRVGSTTKDKKKGMALAYIDARDVMHRLDDVCGPENWQCDYPHAGQKTVCRIGIRIDGEWIWKANGAGDTDIEGEKGALSDAFKRAAVLWGIGQYLYELDSPWVELDTRTAPDGKVYVNGISKQELTRLHKLLGGQSAYSLRMEDAWTAFQNDLLDCHSVAAIEKLYKSLREAGWAQSWLKQAAEACAVRKQEILANAENDDFPGDINNHPLAAG